MSHCESCVLGSICGVGDVCRFGWCRCCGGKLEIVNLFRGWVACPKCGFANVRKKSRHAESRKLVSFG